MSSSLAVTALKGAMIRFVQDSHVLSCYTTSPVSNQGDAPPLKHMDKPLAAEFDVVWVTAGYHVETTQVR